MHLLGYILIIGSCVWMHYYLHVGTPLLFLILGLNALINKFLPRLFIVWVIIGMAVAFTMLFKYMSPYLVFLIGMYGFGLVLQVL